MNESNKFDVVGTNIAEKATVIWNVADMLRGPFKPHEYGLVILPMTFHIGHNLSFAKFHLYKQLREN